MEQFRNSAEKETYLLIGPIRQTDGPGDKFARLKAFVEENLHRKLTLELVASHFGISTSYVSQLFRKHLNVSFHQYLSSRRMETANQLIQSGVPLDQVHRLVGYQDYSSFYRAFRKHFRHCPTHLLRQTP